MPERATVADAFVIARQHRICNICSFHRNVVVPATHVATGYEDDEDVTRLVSAGLWCAMQWYECEGHGPTENKGYVRTTLTPIDEWFKEILGK